MKIQDWDKSGRDVAEGISLEIEVQRSVCSLLWDTFARIWQRT